MSSAVDLLTRRRTSNRRNLADAKAPPQRTSSARHSSGTAAPAAAATALTRPLVSPADAPLSISRAAPSFLHQHLAHVLYRAFTVPSLAATRLLATPVFGTLMRLGLAGASRTIAYFLPLQYYVRYSLAPPLPNVAEEESTEASTVPHVSSRRLLPGCSHDIEIRSSSIHGVGVFAKRGLPRGTRIMTIPKMTFADAVQYELLVGDLSARIPAIHRFTHPSGLIRELPTAASPHMLFNHGCGQSANVCSGLSKCWWPNRGAVKDRGAATDELCRRIATFDYYEDPNSFFVTRSVEAGEELLLDYYCRTVVLAGEHHGLSSILSSSPTCRQRLVVCRCPLSGHSPSGTSKDDSEVVQRPASRSNSMAPDASTAVCRRYIYPNPRGKGATNRKFPSMEEAIRAGYDEELVALSLQKHSGRAATNFLWHCTTVPPDHDREPTVTEPRQGQSEAIMVDPPPTHGSRSWEIEYVWKTRFLMSYRFVFRPLEQLATDNVPHASSSQSSVRSSPPPQ